MLSVGYARGALANLVLPRQAYGSPADFGEIPNQK